jgi:ABC-type branched-subunit amino acid transport system ATPase component
MKQAHPDFVLVSTTPTDCARYVTAMVAQGALPARRILGLLLDEPTSGLGDHETGRVADLLKRLRAAHRLSILVVAHNVGFVQDTSDTVTVLDFGRVIAEGEPDRVIADPEVMAAYLGVAETGTGVGAR